jgi:hypothetical protein
MLDVQHLAPAAPDAHITYANRDGGVGSARGATGGRIA